jgi:hypothetical protein
MYVAYRINGKIQSTTLPELAKANASRVFDNLVQTKGDLETNWEKDPRQSWHKSFLT